MCMGVTAGAYILTLFAVSVYIFSVWLIFLNFPDMVIWWREFNVFFPLDKIHTKGYGFDTRFPLVQSTLLDRMVV